MRGWTDLAINGTFWIGAALGALGSVVLLNADLLPGDLGWRACFFIGAALALVILPMRRWIPESPRWLLTHGQPDDARRIVEDIEARFRREGQALSSDAPTRLRLHTRGHTTLREVVQTLFVTYRRRSLVSLSLMTAQAFFYNAIFFTYALVLTDFYQVPGAHVGWYLLPFAAGNFLGPVVLGAPVRRGRAAPDDCIDLCGLRGAADAQRLPVRAALADGHDADRRVDGGFLLRFGRLRVQPI